MPRSLRFRYNPVFLPEYLSTIALSIAISAVFLLAEPLGGGVGLKGMHANIAFTLYGVIASLLLALTIFYRRKYRRFVFRSDDDHPGVSLHGKGRVFHLADVDRIEEYLGSFFGRKARTVRIEDPQGWPLEIAESVVDYNGLKRLLAELAERPIEPARDFLPEEAEKVREIWEERHEMFPAPRDVSEAFQRVLWRGVCLLPVCVFDILLNAVVSFSLDGLGRMEFRVYSAPLSLTLSGIVARYVYYYLFTSTALNKPIA